MLEIGGAVTRGAIGPEVNLAVSEVTTGSSFEDVRNQAALTSVSAKSAPLNSSGSRAVSARA